VAGPRPFGWLRRSGRSNFSGLGLWLCCSFYFSLPFYRAELPSTCAVMDWRPLTDYHLSELNGYMLHYWGVIGQPKLCCQE
jgi:hypothetical protein